MAKTRQVFSYSECGKQYKVIKQLDCFDHPYSVYQICYDYDREHNCPVKHKKLIAKFDCMWEVFGWFRDNCEL